MVSNVVIKGIKSMKAYMTSSKRAAIVDYEISNLFSVKRACEHSGLNAVITSDIQTILSSDALILPGVGAFGDAMSNLRRLDLLSPIKDFIDTGKPFMGICLGMQLLMTESEEFGTHKGMDIVRGCVVKFSVKNTDKGISDKVPQVGWNKIVIPAFTPAASWENSPLKSIKEGDFMYFVHSYYVKPELNANVLSITDYCGIEYASGLIKDSVFAFQFHPEISGSKGCEIYRNFKHIVEAEVV